MKNTAIRCVKSIEKSLKSSRGLISGGRKEGLFRPHHSLLLRREKNDPCLACKNALKPGSEVRNQKGGTRSSSLAASDMGTAKLDRDAFKKILTIKALSVPKLECHRYMKALKRSV